METINISNGESRCSSFSVDATPNGEMPVRKPRIIYEGRKARAFMDSGKCNVHKSTTAGIEQRIVPSRALTQVVELVISDVTSSDSITCDKATTPY
ncbi:MAG: hypothetical protein IKW22_04860 [Bacteroidaceae bacterium]|nr:hypothetical protein [Bacteroidaceae bacterium]